MNTEKNIQICFVGDLSEEAPKHALLVADDKDYVNAAAFLDSWQGNSSVICWVRKKHYCIWLRNLAEELGMGGMVSETEMTSRLVLASKWNVEIPDWLTDELVTEYQLQAMEIPSYPSDMFIDLLLAVKLSPEYASEKLDPEDLPKLIQAAIDNSTLFESNFILQKALEEKLQSWKENSPYHWTDYLCSQILDNPKELWKNLTLFKLLGTYPEQTLEFLILPEHLISLRSIPQSILKEMELCPEAVEQATQQIELICNEFCSEIKNETDLNNLKEKMSGYLCIEFQALESILKTNKFQVMAATIKAIQKKFMNCYGLNKNELSRLDRFVAPPLPSAPNTADDWKINDWLKWSLDEYIVYRDWQQKFNVFNPEVEKYSQCFSDWYVKQYIEVQKEKKYSLVHSLAEWKEQILSDEISIILLVDCMPLNVWKYLLDAMQSVQLHRHELKYRFTPLPTYTRQVKKLLVSGDWKEESEDYSALLKKRSTTEWNGKNPLYTSSVKELQKFDVSEGNSVILMNYITGDEILHQDHSSSGSSYDAELMDKYGKLAEAVNGVVERVQKSNLVGVYVCTDHGASLILDEERQSLDSNVIKKLFTDEHHRFAKVEKNKIEDFPDNLWRLGYKFQSAFESDETCYFIPKGHNTVKSIKAGKGFVHGGATPEEVIVPTAVFRKAKVLIKKLLVRFLDLKNQKLSAYIQRIQSVKFEIQNPNKEKVEIENISIVSPECDLKPYSIPIIQGKNTAEIELNCIFPASAKNLDSVKLSIEYSVGGEKDSIEIEVSANFNTAMKTGISLEDLLS